MSSHGDNRYAAPTANVADVATAGSVVLASRWARLFGIWIDGFVIWVLTVLLVTIGLPSVWNPWAFPTATPASVLVALNLRGLLYIVLFLLVNGYLLSVRGQTIGKAVLGMRIVRPDGAKATAVRILGLRYGVQYVLGLIPVLGLIYFLLDCVLIFRKSRRCLHDEIADTIVVRT